MKERAMTIDRSRLPIRRQAFGGVANRTLAGSQPDWNVLDAIAAPEGAPNILLVLIDDAGFGNPSTFGGPISTPTFSRVADDGLRYNACHVTALCSPTRVSLLTGRNHHAVGFGSIGELATGFPGYTGFLPRDCAPFPRVLRDNGYSTAAFGKWHLTPDHQQGPAGPFDRWPNAWGFDHFWGFLGGEAGQYDPLLVENHSVLGPPEDPDFYFPDAMAEKTIEWLHAVRAQEPDKPWMTYFSTGCSHARPTTCRRNGARSTRAGSTAGGTPASYTASPTATLPSATPSSTSRSSATAPCTRTAGWRRGGCRGSHGTRRPRR
jgi:hypothetical protein